MRYADLIPLVRMLGIGLVVMCFMAVMTSVQRRKATVRDGWRYLTPGPVVWMAVAGGLLLTGVFTLVYASGTSRAEGLLGITVFFNLVTAALAYSIFAEEVRWNDTRIERRTYFLQRRSLTWHQLAAVGYEPSGFWWVSGYDGPRIRFSDYNHGFRELAATIMDNLPPDGPPPEAVVAMREALVPVRAR